MFDCTGPTAGHFTDSYLHCHCCYSHVFFFFLGFREGTDITQAWGGSACDQRSTNLIVVHLIGIGSFVLGLFQGLSRPLIYTRMKPHTDTHCLVIITVRRVLSGG